MFSTSLNLILLLHLGTFNAIPTQTKASATGDAKKCRCQEKLMSRNANTMKYHCQENQCHKMLTPRKADAKKKANPKNKQWQQITVKCQHQKKVCVQKCRCHEIPTPKQSESRNDNARKNVMPRNVSDLRTLLVKDGE